MSSYLKELKADYLTVKKESDKLHKLILSGVLDGEEYKEKRMRRYDLNKEVKRLKKLINIENNKQAQINKHKYVAEVRNKQGHYITLLKDEIIKIQGAKQASVIFERIDSIVNKETIEIKTELTKH